MLLINKDPNTTYLVSLAWSGYAPGPNPTAYFYGESSKSITAKREPGTPPDYVQVIPPYSLTTLVVSPTFHRAG